MQINSQCLILSNLSLILTSCICRKVNVQFGAHDICEEDWISTHVVRPARFIFHPGYNPQTEDNDIAILKLKRDVNFGPKEIKFIDFSLFLDCFIFYSGLDDQFTPG